MDQERRKALIARIKALGGEDATPAIPLDDFLEGNDDDGSFAANAGMSLARFAARLTKIQEQPDVQGVYILINELMEQEEHAWPYSEVALIYTTAAEDEVSGWFGKNTRPDELNELDPSEGLPPGAPEPLPGTTIFEAWWD